MMLSPIESDSNAEGNRERKRRRMGPDDESRVFEPLTQISAPRSVIPASDTPITRPRDGRKRMNRSMNLEPLAKVLEKEAERNNGTSGQEEEEEGQGQDDEEWDEDLCEHDFTINKS